MGWKEGEGGGWREGVSFVLSLLPWSPLPPPPAMASEAESEIREREEGEDGETYDQREKQRRKETPKVSGGEGQSFSGEDMFEVSHRSREDSESDHEQNLHVGVGGRWVNLLSSEENKQQEKKKDVPTPTRN